MKVLCFTSDTYLWAIKPFIYLFNNYWSELQDLYVVGFTPPTFELPNNVQFMSLAPDNFPPEKWSDALMMALRRIDDTHVTILLEDYWFTRMIDYNGVRTLAEYMEIHDDVLRIDLTDDRLHARGDARYADEVGSWGHYDLIETEHGTPYQMSLQAGIWNKRLLLKLLQPGLSPWEVEINIQPPADMRVLGTRQWPVKYANAILKGKLVKEEINKIPEDHRKIVRRWIPDEFPRE